jgi:uncharacterized membrane protein
MFILSILPEWVFHAITIAGVLGTIVGFVLGMIPVIKTYIIPIRVISILLLSFGLFLEGGLADYKVWEARVKEVEAKLAEAEVQSAKENTKIVTKVITKTQVVKTRGQDIVRYVDREIVKYDEKFAKGGICEIPKEFIKAHNDAAEAVK